MKTKKICLSALFLITAVMLSAEESKPLSMSLSTDLQYSPKNEYIAGGNHYSPITGAFGSAAGRVVFNLNYKIPTPLGENFLLSGANVTLNTNVELTPVTILPAVKATFSPLPFLEFQAGAAAGSGWNIGGIQGIATYHFSNTSYETKNPFSHLYIKAWAQGLFQFDTGAIWSGDWTHVLIQYTYQSYFLDLYNTSSRKPWLWQASGNNFNGWHEYQCLILAYQLPSVVRRIGCMLETERLYSDKNINTRYLAYNPEFNNIKISPLVQFQFGEKDTLNVCITFANRRSFEESHTSAGEEPLLTYAGNEWYFNRVALSYTHNF